MKLKANDTLHISAVKPDNIQPNEEFEVSKHIGDDLVKRGLATVVDDDKPVNAEKKEPPLANKAEKPVANKAIIAATTQSKA